MNKRAGPVLAAHAAAVVHRAVARPPRSVSRRSSPAVPPHPQAFPHRFKVVARRVVDPQLAATVWLARRTNAPLDHPVQRVSLESLAMRVFRDNLVSQAKTLRMSHHRARPKFASTAHKDLKDRAGHRVALDPVVTPARKASQDYLAAMVNPVTPENLDPLARPVAWDCLALRARKRMTPSTRSGDLAPRDSADRWVHRDRLVTLVAARPQAFPANKDHPVDPVFEDHSARQARTEMKDPMGVPATTPSIALARAVALVLIVPFLSRAVSSEI